MSFPWATDKSLAECCPSQLACGAAKPSQAHAWSSSMAPSSQGDNRTMDWEAAFDEVERLSSVYLESRGLASICKAPASATKASTRNSDMFLGDDFNSIDEKLVTEMSCRQKTQVISSKDRSPSYDTRRALEHIECNGQGTPHGTNDRLEDSSRGKGGDLEVEGRALGPSTSKSIVRTTTCRREGPLATSAIHVSQNQSRRLPQEPGLSGQEIDSTRAVGRGVAQAQLLAEEEDTEEVRAIDRATFDRPLSFSSPRRRFRHVPPRVRVYSLGGAPPNIAPQESTLERRTEHLERDLDKENTCVQPINLARDFDKENMCMQSADLELDVTTAFRSPKKRRLDHTPDRGKPPVPLYRWDHTPDRGKPPVPLHRLDHTPDRGKPSVPLFHTSTQPGMDNGTENRTEVLFLGNTVHDATQSESPAAVGRVLRFALGDSGASGVSLPAREEQANEIAGHGTNPLSAPMPQQQSIQASFPEDGDALGKKGDTEGFDDSVLMEEVDKIASSYWKTKRSLAPCTLQLDAGSDLTSPVHVSAEQGGMSDEHDGLQKLTGCDVLAPATDVPGMGYEREARKGSDGKDQGENVPPAQHNIPAWPCLRQNDPNSCHIDPSGWGRPTEPNSGALQQTANPISAPDYPDYHSTEHGGRMVPPGTSPKQDLGQRASRAGIARYFKKSRQSCDGVTRRAASQCDTDLGGAGISGRGEDGRGGAPTEPRADPVEQATGSFAPLLPREEYQVQGGPGHASSAFLDRRRGMEGGAEGSHLNPGGTENPVPRMAIDEGAARFWAYPSNRERRQYQFDIAQRALFSNTLVCLPTGLGKTLIAAVVMYNFYCWFPRGVLVFMAPTRPLVLQQISACKRIVPIPSSEIVHMTGQMKREVRSQLWRTKRVFFVTGQVLERDLTEWDVCPRQSIVCCVVDEAHRATGNYAYCRVVETLLASGVQCRVLGLTATPGSKSEKVQEVIDKLNISAVEFRDDEDPDVRRYIHKRDEEVIKVKMSDVMKETEALLRVELQKHVGVLTKCAVLKCATGAQVSSYQVRVAGQLLETQHRNWGLHQAATVNRALMCAEALAAVVERMACHGMRSALNALRDSCVYNLLKREEGLRKAEAVMASVVQQGRAQSSPKLPLLERIVLEHFQQHQDSSQTRVIIFTTYRDSVEEIVGVLKGNVPAAHEGTSSGHAPSTLRVREFIGQSGGKERAGARGGDEDESELPESLEAEEEDIDTEVGVGGWAGSRDTRAGQGARVGGQGGGKQGKQGERRRMGGQTQKVQQAVLAAFNKGEYNVLVATAIGEEGLDISGVDLVVCFDAVSVMRMTQRMGRTGRMRDGRAVILAMEGLEHDRYTKKIRSGKTLSKQLRQSATHFVLHDSPRMLPHRIPRPALRLLPMHAPEEEEENTEAGQGQGRSGSGAKGRQGKRRGGPLAPLSAEEQARLEEYPGLCDVVSGGGAFALPVHLLSMHISAQVRETGTKHVPHGPRSSRMLVPSLRRLRWVAPGGEACEVLPGGLAGILAGEEAAIGRVSAPVKNCLAGEVTGTGRVRSSGRTSIVGEETWMGSAIGPMNSRAGECSSIGQEAALMYRTAGEETGIGRGTAPMRNSTAGEDSRIGQEATPMKKSTARNRGRPKRGRDVERRIGLGDDGAFLGEATDEQRDGMYSPGRSLAQRECAAQIDLAQDHLRTTFPGHLGGLAQNDAPARDEPEDIFAACLAGEAVFKQHTTSSGHWGVAEESCTRSKSLRDMSTILGKGPALGSIFPCAPNRKRDTRDPSDLLANIDNVLEVPDSEDEGDDDCFA